MTNTVTYSLGYKRALPNYENTTAFFSITRDVPEGKTEDEVFDEITEAVEARLTAKIEEIDADLGN